MYEHVAPAPGDRERAEPAIARPPLAPASLTAQMLALQRTAGNRATVAAARRMLARSGLSDWWHAVEINAVDERLGSGIHALTGPVTNLTRLNTVHMRSVSGMVNGVLEMLGGEDRIKRLNILDHGSKSSVQFGDEHLHAGNVDLSEADFRRLRGKFTSTGFVHVQNCRAGAHRYLLAALARYMGVRVVAGEGLQNPLVRFNTGDYVDVNPDGSSSTHWWGPGWR